MDNGSLKDYRKIHESGHSNPCFFETYVSNYIIEYVKFYTWNSAIVNPNLADICNENVCEISFYGSLPD